MNKNGCWNIPDLVLLSLKCCNMPRYCPSLSSGILVLFFYEIYVLLQSEQKKDVTIIIKLMYLSSIRKFDNDCDVILMFKMQ